MRGRPILGAVSGLLLGVFVAIDLQQFGVRPFDTTLVVGAPVIGLLVGLAVARLAPLGRGRGR